MSLRLAGATQVHCAHIKQQEFTLEWTAEDQLVPGSQFELRAGTMRSMSYWRYVQTEVTGADVIWRCPAYASATDLWRNRQNCILRARLQYTLQPGDRVVFRLRALPPIYAGLDGKYQIWVAHPPNSIGQDEAELSFKREAESTCVVPVVAGPVERLSVLSHPAGGPAETVRTLIVPEDRFGNPSQFTEPVEAVLTWCGMEQKLVLAGTSAVELSASAGIERAEVRIPMDTLAAGENVANGVRQGAHLCVMGNPVWPRTSGDRMPAFGEFHWHTNISGDGDRDLEESLRCARDELNMNFAAPGDHNSRGDGWTRTVSALDAVNVDDEFATFYGWEDGSRQGHQNYYFLDPEHPVICGGAAGITGGGPLANNDKLAGLKDVIAIPHHTNATSETRRIADDTPMWVQYPILDPIPPMRLFEIMQVRGLQERNDYSEAWRGWHQHNCASAQDFLAKGYRIGFVGGTDNHAGWPGRAWDYTEAGIGANNRQKSVILTGIWTERVTRNDVFAALQRRNTWAVWDTRAILRFTVNDVLMGDEQTLTRGAHLRARIRLSAEDALQTIEIIANGEVVWQQSHADPDVDLSVDLGSLEKSQYVYVRALQRNGGIVIGSPVFLDVDDDLGG